MNQSPLGTHWFFAAGAAFEALRKLVRAFDFDSLCGNANYVGVSPRYLMEVIDGFLTESSDVVPGGNRAELAELRNVLVTSIEPAYDEGVAAGSRSFTEAGCIESGVSWDDLPERARSSTDRCDYTRDWFVEGFCYGWTSAHLDALKREAGDEQAGRGG